MLLSVNDKMTRFYRLTLYITVPTRQNGSYSLVVWSEIDVNNLHTSASTHALNEEKISGQ